MKIAFLGTGRMGTELARHLLAEHSLTVWNRTASRTRTLTELGARAADTPQEAVEGADVVVSCLFGPDTVREVIIAPQLIPEAVPWIDATTVSPADAADFAKAIPTYVATPVVGTIGPARNGSLGVYVGSTDKKLRTLAAEVVAPWADPERLRLVDSAPKAALGKLMANLALAISAEGFREALLFADAAGLTEEEALSMLDSTGLGFIKNMKAPFVTGERTPKPGDFTADAIAKDVRFMLNIADRDLPALEGALHSFEEQQEAGRGNEDFSNILIRRRG